MEEVHRRAQLLIQDIHERLGKRIPPPAPSRQTLKNPSNQKIKGKGLGGTKFQGGPGPPTPPPPRYGTSWPSLAS